MKCCTFIIDNTESHKDTNRCFWIRENQMSKGSEIQELRRGQVETKHPPSEVHFFYSFIHNLPPLSWDLSEFIRLFSLSWCCCNLQMQQQLRLLLAGFKCKYISPWGPSTACSGGVCHAAPHNRRVLCSSWCSKTCWNSSHTWTGVCS